MYFHVWLIAKSWLNFIVDDIKEDYKIEKKKLKKNHWCHYYDHHL
jgi:hypothetical protein